MEEGGRWQIYFLGEWLVYYSDSCHGPHGVSLWKNIRGGWAKFERFIYFKVGNGARIRF